MSLLLAASLGLASAPLLALAQDAGPPAAPSQSTGTPDATGAADGAEATGDADASDATAQPSGPALAVSDPAPLACDPSASRQRFLEVRGDGFDAWALQRLRGAVVDGAGQPAATWNSVWVSPQGRLTLEIGLCASPFRGRPALAPGTYMVTVGSTTGAPIASTAIELAAPPEVADTQATDDTQATENAAP
jgi:hypothetical protein